MFFSISNNQHDFLQPFPMVAIVGANDDCQQCFAHVYNWQQIAIRFKMC